MFCYIILLHCRKDSYTFFEAHISSSPTHSHTTPRPNSEAWLHHQNQSESCCVCMIFLFVNNLEYHLMIKIMLLIIMHHCMSNQKIESHIDPSLAKISNWPVAKTNQCLKKATVWYPCACRSIISITRDHSQILESRPT